MAVAVILGSSFERAVVDGTELRPEAVRTPHGEVILHRWPRRDDAFVLFRHGIPHRLLPNQIPYRAHAAALRQVDCGALLVTSSVGVIDPALPLMTPLPIDDLLMPDNRLPDGSTCTMFDRVVSGQGHLVIREGLFSRALAAQVAQFAADVGWSTGAGVIFAYSGGPRTKTAAENAYWARSGAQVNSMTVGPEVVLANELEIPTSGLVVGHKYSTPGGPSLDDAQLRDSLADARHGLERLVARFLDAGTSQPFANTIYRYGD